MARRYLVILKGEIPMFVALTSMLREEDGATMVEYGLLVALIALVALAAVQTLGVNLSSLFTNVGTSV
jgi:pilus assembly protein Flp/PilA